MRLDPRVAALRSAVGDVLAGIDDAATVLVACSGGPDSVALAGAAAFHARRRSGRVGAVIVDHGLQKGSAEVAEQAAKVCRALELDPVIVVAVHVDGSRNVEAGARAARYAALEQVARQESAGAVLLGHTLEDQAETVLLALARGSGGRSLAGMARRRGILHRPFLGLARKDVAAAGEWMLAAAGIHLLPWQDPHNRDDAYARVRVRQHLLPDMEKHLGPGVAQALARTASQLRDDADLLDRLACDLLRSAHRDDGHDVEPLRAAHPALRRRALHQLILAQGCPAGQVTAHHVVAMDRLLTDWHGQGPIDLPGRRQGGRSCGRLWVTPTSRHGESR